MPDSDRREELQDAIRHVRRLSGGEATSLPNPFEVATVAGFALQLPSKADTWDLTWATSLTCAPAEEWLHIRFEPRPPFPTGVKGIEGIDLVLWRFTLAVYPVLPDGSTPDDPITPGQFAERFR